MERRQAMAWAGSIAVFGCVSALLLGALAGGFGFTSTPPPQALQPKVIDPEPGLPAIPPRPEPDSPRIPPGPTSPAPVLPDPGPGAATTGAIPVPEPVPKHYPRAPSGYTQLSAAALPLSAPPRDTGAVDPPAPKKAPYPVAGKVPLCNIPVIDALKPVIKNFTAQDIAERILRAQSRDNGGPVLDRLPGTGPKVRVNDRPARGRDGSPDG
jgi:hypothetical protein